MRVQYDASLDDLVDVALRSLARSQAGSSWRWAESVIAGAIAGLGLFFVIPEGFTTRLVFGLAAGVAAACVHPLLSNMALKSRLRAMFRASHGQGPIPVEVELSPASVVSKEGRITVTIPWTDLSVAKETSDTIDLLGTRGELMVLVRKRGFESPEAARQFVEEAARLIKDAQGSLSGS